MNVDFNNLRKQTISAYSDLCETLNANIDEYEESVTVSVHTLQQSMDWLRSCIVGIACSYLPGNDEVKDMSSHLEGMPHFNYEEEEEVQEEVEEPETIDPNQLTLEML
jgi:hypothetical protein